MLLVDVAARLRSHDMIVRFGGDEFQCLCQGLNGNDAHARLALVNADLARS